MAWQPTQIQTLASPAFAEPLVSWARAVRENKLANTAAPSEVTMALFICVIVLQNG
jgi:hypothetical protein